MSSYSDDLLVEVKSFDWNKYLTVTNAKEVPKYFFYHICKSEINGIELGSVVEIENEDKSGYWFANTCLTKGVLINLHYFGDDSDKHDFWLEVNSTRIHPLNWGSENNKKLIPPERFLRSEDIKGKVHDFVHSVSNTVLQLKDTPIYNIFKPDMFVEVQDREYPYHVWISKVLKNVGGRLFLQIQGIKSPKKKPFWVFYLNDSVFPLGWAQENGLPWRVMNLEYLDANLKNAIDSSVLLNVLKRKTPEQHGYKVGEMLEVINPYSLMEFYVATIVKIYDHHYFKVEVDNEIDVEKRISFLATKENPYIFNAGWATKHKFILKPPSDWKKSNKFSWSKYILLKNSKLASVDIMSRKNINHVHPGMKLEAVDPLNSKRIRVATVKGFADHWMFLSFDSINCHQELLHVRSVNSNEVFPVGWCNKHKYSLTVPKFPYRDNLSFDNNGLIESSKDISNEDYEKGKSTISKKVKKKKNVIEPIFNKKKQKKIVPKLDEELHTAFLNVKVDNVQKNIYSVKEKKNTAKEVNPKKYKEINNIDAIIEYVVNNTTPKNSHEMCIYFNKDCYSGGGVVKKKIPTLPNSIGPGLISSILHQAITVFVGMNYFPRYALKKIKKNENMLFNGHDGVEILINTNGTGTHSRSSEYLLIPGSKKMAGTYCSALCNLFNMCDFFMTTENIKCPHSCTVKKLKTLQLKSRMKTMPINKKYIKIMAKSNVSESSDCCKKRKVKDLKNSQVVEKVIDWSNAPLVERYKKYFEKINSLDTQLNQIITELESSLIAKMIFKKNDLSKMDNMIISSNNKSEVKTIQEKRINVFDDWKSTFENYYHQNPIFKKFKIDIGKIEHIEINSNPKYWSSQDVCNYLTNDVFCKDIASKLYAEKLDGVAFMLLNEEQLLKRLSCSINLVIRVMCHVAEAKIICLTKY